MVTLAVSVTVTLDVLKMAVSPEPGTPLGDQFAAVPQLPLLPAAQVYVVGSCRTSSGSTCGRNLATRILPRPRRGAGCTNVRICWSVCRMDQTVPSVNAKKPT